MLNINQVKKFLNDLGLHYEWNYPAKGASTVIVEGTIKYTPFSHWVTDLRSGETFHSDDHFRKLCMELAHNN